MTYRVEAIPLAQEQVLTLPHVGQLAYAALSDRLAEDPWEGAPWIDRASSAMKQTVFGEHGEGLATYVIVDRDDRVVVVRIAWL